MNLFDVEITSQLKTLKRIVMFEVNLLLGMETHNNKFLFLSSPNKQFLFLSLHQTYKLILCFQSESSLSSLSQSFIYKFSNLLLLSHSPKLNNSKRCISIKLNLTLAKPGSLWIIFRCTVFKEYLFSYGYKDMVALCGGIRTILYPKVLLVRSIYIQDSLFIYFIRHI